MSLMFIRALFISAIIVIGSLALTGLYRRYTGTKLWQSALLCMLAAGLGIALAAYVDHSFHYSSASRDREPFVMICAVLLPLLTMPFAVRLYGKWIGGHLTDTEQLPGIDGVRAWLGVGNVICAGLIPICVWQVFGYSPIGIGALTFGLLLAYPMLNMISQSAQPATAVPAEDLSKEREKVLQLLEAGKISAADSAELLNALAQSTPPSAPKPTAEINSQRKLVLVGAAVLLAGFFLPWFAINPNAEANKMTAQFRQNMNQMMPGNAMPPMNFSLPDTTVQIHAGDVAHGLGWWILALGMAAAVLPFFATTLESSMQKKIILAVLGIGAILLIYLLSDTLRYVSFGILLALAGYVLEVVGTVKERPAAS
jgi:hypothetical protein